MELDLESILSLSPGSQIAERYEILGCLGLGSAGLVYLCQFLGDPGCLLAMKVLAPEDLEKGFDPTRLARFHNEILQTYRVHHTNVVRTFEFINKEDFVAYTMEYVRGGDLASLLHDEEPLYIHESIRILSEMCEGVQAIHDADIIHRDIKPANILLTEERSVKITDFGIARGEDTPTFTASGGVVGTIRYLSPQYLEEGRATKSGDLYAIGVIAYELITGVNPYAGLGLIQAIQAKTDSDPEPPHLVNPECSEELGNIILKAMARNPAEAFASALELKKALLEAKPTVVPSSRALRRDRVLTDEIEPHATFEQPYVPGMYNHLRKRLSAMGFVAGLAATIVLFISFQSERARVNLRDVPQMAQLSANASPSTMYDREELAVTGTQEDIEHDESGVMLAMLDSSDTTDVTNLVLDTIETEAVQRPVTPVSQGITDEPDLFEAPAVKQDDQLRLAEVFKEEFVKELVVARASETVEVEPEEETAPRGIVPGKQEVLPRPPPANEPSEQHVKLASLTRKVSPQPESFEPPIGYKVRATLLYRFADYIQWPQSAFVSASSPIEICLLGKDPFGSHFDTHLSALRSRTGRGYRVTRLSNLKASAGCHILYAGEGVLTSADAIQLSREPILVVGEKGGEGMIQFILRRRKVKFTVNVHKAKDAGLGVGPVLLDLAHQVYR